uniref:PH domain-containing protein n=1 Tax=Clastoptera arizonana TaxID=38151 RepID=A0A1B6CSY6_9HEMI
MDNLNLLAEVRIFLKETLISESLSEKAETCRKELLKKLDYKETSPQPYLDMNLNSKGGQSKLNNQFHSLNECYEILTDKCREDNEGIKSNINNNNSESSSENEYYNVPCLIKPSKSDISLDKKKNSCLTSIEDNRKKSLQSTKKDSTDLTSDSSSLTYSSSSKSDEAGEVLTMSASALRYSAVKYGPLSRKDKFLLFDILKQYWAALLNHTLYVYNSEKDNKPIMEFDITGYQARPISLKDSSKKDFSFEIIAPGMKTHQFIAESSLEMEQWVLAICQAGKISMAEIKPEAELCQPKETARQLPSLPLPQLLLYDQPTSSIRPVNPPQEVYEAMQENSESLYYYIKHPKENTSKEIEDVMYTNGNVSLDSSKEISDTNMYYNLNPYPEYEYEECVYDVITEKPIKDSMHLLNTPKTEYLNQDINQCSIKDKNLPGLIIQEEIYELVN